MPIPTIKELNGLLDEKTYDIYKNGLTCTINQADSDFATALIKKYKPTSPSEMSAFVAILRPGCASLRDGFINREPYTTSVPELDAILEDSGHRLIYQESIMKYLIWLGIPETGSYDIIKKIAKKKFKEPELAELKKKLTKGWMKQVGKLDGFDRTWTVVEQAAKYSFNASHSLSYAYDSLYGAYLKSHYPLEYYSVVFNYYKDDTERTAKLKKELEYFGIHLKPAKFRYSKSKYIMSKEDNSIYKGVESIKAMNGVIADEIYTLKDNVYNSFIELRDDLTFLEGVRKNHIRMLIELDFFNEFGDINYLEELNNLYEKFAGKTPKKQIRKEFLDEKGIPYECAKKYAGKETAKMFSDVDMIKFLCEAAKYINVPKAKISKVIKAQVEYLGYTDIQDVSYKGIAFVLDVNTKYSPKVKFHSMKTGNDIICKISKKLFMKKPLKVGDMVKIKKQVPEPRKRMGADGKFITVPGETDWWIKGYDIIEDL